MKKFIMFILISAIFFEAITLPKIASNASSESTKDSAEVYVTISDSEGKLAVTQKKITVEDIDKDGKLTINDALHIVHELKYDGGADVGYEAAKTQYGLSLTKLWGDTSGTFGYFLNNASAWSLEDTVKDGDIINAFVYTTMVDYGDYSMGSDEYCFFDSNFITGSIGEEITLTLSAAGFDAEYNPITVPVDNATITIDGEDTSYTTDANGKVSIVITASGSHTISATSATQVLVPPVCKADITVSGEPLRAQELIDGIVTLKQDDRNIQSWINQGLSENSGTGAEWYVLALSQYGAFDFSHYETALLEYLYNTKISADASKLKYALCLKAIGSNDSYIDGAVKETADSQGIMALIFKLHLLNNTETYTEANDGAVKISHAIDSILSKQLSCGGWAVMGENAEIDVTAMTLQALAPHYNSNDGVKAAADKALSLLSESQKEDGDFANYGVNNPESTAQVLIALSSLDIDFSKDSRFIKNGNTLLDGIEKFRLDDGSFCHMLGGDSNENATMQVFQAMVSYIRFTQDKTPIYILDVKGGGSPDAAPSSLPTPSPTAESESAVESESTDTKVSYKVWVSLAIIILALALTAILIATKKFNKKNLIVIILVAALAIVFVCATNFSSPEKYYSGEATSKENPTGKVTLTILCDKLIGKTDDEHVPSDGVILKPCEFEIEAGDTAYDILIEAAKKYKLQLENTVGSTMAYISGINCIYEFDYGDLSGWVYRVNGSSPSVGCGEYKLSDGDIIEWHYSLDLGNDIK